MGPEGQDSGTMGPMFLCFNELHKKNVVKTKTQASTQQFILNYMTGCVLALGSLSQTGLGDT